MARRGDLGLPLDLAAGRVLRTRSRALVLRKKREQLQRKDEGGGGTTMRTEAPKEMRELGVLACRGGYKSSSLPLFSANCRAPDLHI